MERNVCLLIDDLFLKGSCDANADLIVVEFGTCKTIIHTKFNQFLFKDYLLLKKYELFTWNSSIYWNDKHNIRCSGVVLYVRKFDNLKEVKLNEIN